MFIFLIDCSVVTVFKIDVCIFNVFYLLVFCWIHDLLIFYPSPLFSSQESQYTKVISFNELKFTIFTFMDHMFCTSENSPVLVLKYVMFSKYQMILLFKHKYLF